jgi:uncharacterized protein (DUF1697 family)
MRYVALLRKINVGTANRVEKKRLEGAFVDLGYEGVEIYINSGNVLFGSTKKKSEIAGEVDEALAALFKAPIRFLLKTAREMRVIGEAIPAAWKNDEEQRTDIAYLFPAIDRPGIVGELPFKEGHVRVIYAKGALIMNVAREQVLSSRYAKIIGTELYKHMTLRNVNTARYLAGGGGD